MGLQRVRHDFETEQQEQKSHLWGFPGGSAVKNPPASAEDAGDLGLIPGLGRSPGRGNSNLLQYSCLKNLMDRDAWWARVPGVAKSWTWLSDRAHAHLIYTSIFPQQLMLWKCWTQYTSKFGKLSSGHRTGKGQFSFQSQRKAMPKNVQPTTQLHSSHMLAK